METTGLNNSTNITSHESIDRDSDISQIDFWICILIYFFLCVGSFLLCVVGLDKPLKIRNEPLKNIPIVLQSPFLTLGTVVERKTSSNFAAILDILIILPNIKPSR